MALTGLDIFKLLPKTNCGECGVPTCMAFAMKIAAKAAELSVCPYASDEAKDKLGAASKPPIRSIKLGSADREVTIGGEIVMFRHDKTFVNQTAFAIAFRDDQQPDEIAQRAAVVRDYCLERVGEQLTVDLALIENMTGEVEPFVVAAKKIAGTTDHGVILKSENPDAIEAALDVVDGRRPLIHAATIENAELMAKLALDHGAALVARADTLDELYDLTTKLAGMGVQDIVLDLPSDNPALSIQYNTIIRKAALKGACEPMGYPIINFLTGLDLPELVADASSLICKYASILVIDSLNYEALLPMMMLRQNIFTDPQKPIQVEPKVYEIGDASEDSPVLVTTNFSLTYFIVSGEIENSGVPAHLAIVECEGMSVLTAWAAGKFSGEKIATFIKESGLADKIKSRKLVIPGYVAQISGELEENLPGWEISVGPQEASDLGPYMKMLVA